MLSHLLNHLNPSSSENILLAIKNINHLEMSLGDSSIYYMSCVRGVSKCLQGISIDEITPLFKIAILDQNRYPGIKSRYLARYLELINCDLLGLSGIIYSKETRQQALGLPADVPRVTEKWTSDVTAPPPPTNRNQTCPGTPTGTCPTTYYPPTRGFPWKPKAEMIRTDRSCTVCHLTKPMSCQD